MICKDTNYINYMIGYCSFIFSCICFFCRCYMKYLTLWGMNTDHFQIEV
ncbi:hypothetical protein HMPREF0653_00692 [Prevotella disiens JCM 6334 = ATCC 29426]|uniref:Uncharacterized protein n=1 Tax=Prevotella disiens JCM 6334 = ATCC 29426 TaxID=1235811 RepID=A0ABN0NU96_9BACT|nr:hypothetical protein HMPREF0653_00692 [Prevotella disiens JCM 6334 = ATCC 29426]